MKKLILITIFLIISGSISANGDDEHGNAPESTNPQTPFVEVTSLSYEVVIVYNNVQPGVETLLKIYISDFRTNVPTNNASVTLDISGANIISQPVKVEPGIYESKVLFPALQKYDMLIAITANGIEDLLAINEVDIARQTPVTTDEESGFFHSLFESYYFWIFIGIKILLLIAFLFYRLGRNTRIYPKRGEKL